ncbi:MAG TPA: hypothetical protein VFJ60_09095 [Gaiella sp.]|nr:hypothetical protein [Gaiella sp.]
MQGTGTGAAAMLVGSAEDVGGRPDAATITLAREEIEEALASDAPLDLILAVQAGGSEPRDVRVSWQRGDLETVLGTVPTGPVTFSFDRAELYRALEHPDFEGHGMREIVLVVAAAASSAALMASTATAQVMDAGGGGAVGAVMDASGGGTTGAVMDASGGGTTGAAMDASGGGATGAAMDASGGGTTGAAMDASGGGTTGAAMDASGGSGGAGAVAVPGHAEAATAGILAASTAIHDEAGGTARGVGQTVPGNDEATLVARGIDPAIATAIGSGDATTARDLATPATPASGSSFDLPSIDAGTAAVVGGLAGAGLLILGGAFAARRQRVTPV